MPSKERFYSSLTGKKIGGKEYDNVLKVWNKSEMKTMKGYHDLYLECDVLLLADVFQKFKNNSLQSYLSALALSWDAMLNMTKVELELIPDLDMYIFLEKRYERWSLLYL